MDESLNSSSEEMLELSTSSKNKISSREKPPERNLWREHEIIALLETIKAKNVVTLLNDKSLRSPVIFRMVEAEMIKKGYTRKSFQQIWTKWKFLKCTYTTSRRQMVRPKIVSNEVYELLDEILRGGAECGLTSSDGENSFDYSMEMGGVGGGNGVPIIANVQGGVGNGFVDMEVGNRAHFLDEDDMNGHAIFGNRLGLEMGINVKSEPIDADECDEDTTAGDEEFLQPIVSDTFGYHDPTSEPETSQSSSGFFPVEAELAPSPTLPRQARARNSAPVIPPLPPLHMNPLPPTLAKIRQNSQVTITSTGRRTGLVSHSQSLADLPKLKHYPDPLRPIKVVATKTVVPPLGYANFTTPPKVPPLRISTRKRRLVIPAKPSTSRNAFEEQDEPKLIIPKLEPEMEEYIPTEYPKEEEDSPTAKKPKATYNQATYGKAIKELAVSLKEAQKELIAEFFHKQRELVREEHNFQLRQDQLLLKSFSEQTKLLLEGTRNLLTAHMPPMAPNVVYIEEEDE